MAKRKAPARSQKKSPPSLSVVPGGKIEREEQKAGQIARVLFGSDGVRITVGQFCNELSIANDTVQRRLRSSNIEPIKHADGNRYYRLRELVDVVLLRDDAGRIDPNKMDPYRRKAHFDAELGKLEMERKSGDLIPRIEVEAEMSRVAKGVNHMLDTLPDVLERDCGLSGAALLKVEERTDALREEFAEQLAQGATSKEQAA